MANSSDVLQATLEREHRHTLFMLEELRKYQCRFQSIGLLSKNPQVLLDDDRYIAALLDLGVEVQVSIAFFRDDAAAALEPGAPLVSVRRVAVEQLAARGVSVVLRLDPLFPRGVPDTVEYQRLELDLIPLITWAAGVPVAYVITSPLKLPFRRYVVPEFHQAVLPAFPIVRGSYRRMPPELEQALVADLRQLGTGAGLRVEHCFANILRRNPSCHLHSLSACS